MKAGIVTVCPPLPSATGAPGTLLTMISAAAPAASALNVFSEPAHVPRKARAVSPVREPAGNGLQNCAAVFASTSRPSNRSSVHPPGGIAPDHDWCTV
jgi:hypothetical protein